MIRFAELDNVKHKAVEKMLRQTLSNERFALNFPGVFQAVMV